MENEVKEPALKYNAISPETYLEMERVSHRKHEYFKGEVFAMAGASPEHNDIAYNINRIIAPYLHGKGCKLYGSDFRIHIPSHSFYTYPDFSIVCGNTASHTRYTDNLTNPVVIIEILSPSTRDYDRGTKFMLYRAIGSLKEYVLIDSCAISVEHFERQSDNSWRLTEFTDAGESFILNSIGLTLALDQLYEDVVFSGKSSYDRMDSFTSGVQESVAAYGNITPEEYLAFERSVEYRNEYYYGRVMAMPGGSLKHSVIAGNLVTTLTQFLKGKDCISLPSHMRVSTPGGNACMYPDASIVCGEPRLQHDTSDTLLNPSVIFEILSPAASHMDKGRKFFFYQQIPSLREYILIDSLEPIIYVSRKQNDHSWKHETVRMEKEFIFIETIGYPLSFAAIYEDIRF